MKKNIAITGGCGFIGSHLVDNLLTKEYHITVFDRHYNEKMFEEYNWKNKVEFRLGDLKDRDSVFELVSHSDIVVNLGGLLGTQEMIENPIEAINVNILGAINVFDAIRLHKKRGFTIGVGNFWMNNPYSITKTTAERFALMYNKEHKTDIRVCRGMNVYGERQKPYPIRKIFPNLAIPALLNKPITIYEGNQIMDLIYVKDFAEILSRIILFDNIPNDIIFEAGMGGDLTINTGLELVLKLTNSESEIKRLSMRPGETLNSIVQISEKGLDNLEKYLGYSRKDFTSLEKGFQKSIDWYSENLKNYNQEYWN